MVQLLINPLSNNKKGMEAEKRIREQFEGEEVCLQDIRKIASFKEFFDSICNDDIVVVAGGDGTISRFADDICGCSIQNELFYFPCGSGNDFFNDVRNRSGIKNNLVPLNEYLSSLPVIEVNGKTRCFINGIGLGVDGYVCDKVEDLKKVSGRKINYTAVAIRCLLFGFKPVNAKVTVDGVTKEYSKVWFVPCMIGKFYGGGMMIAPSQDRSNREKTVTCVVVHTLSALRILTIFPKIFTGGHVKYKQYIDFTKAHEVYVEFDKPCALQIDGETVKNVISYKVKYGV